MATTANPPPGAIPTNNGASDPFVGPGSGALRYASATDLLSSSYSTNSPSQAKRALEAHLKDTDRRIQDASRLGGTLVQQRKELAAKLDEVKQVQQDNEVPAPLRKRLVELEREVNDVGKESARAFLPKSSTTNGGGPQTEFSGQARESPTKVGALSRRQRNQPSSRVHDIEFAAEISTSLLAQVRQLQTALAEKDDVLRDVQTRQSLLESEAAGLLQRIRQMDESEQRVKDENWNLEVRLQNLEGELRDAVDKHDRVHASLKGVEGEKTSALRELDELRVAHDSLQEEHGGVRRAHEGEKHALSRDLSAREAEKGVLQRKVEELTGQNVELARAVSSRWNQQGQTTDGDAAAASEERDEADLTPDEQFDLNTSPVKGTPRHGMLESETLKSSLNHAHRMIQNLKNNIHREKTEKIELKRLLQDARDELESRRNGDNGTKKRSSQQDKGFKKPARPDRVGVGLGGNRSSTTTIETLEDEPDWEEDVEAQEGTPSKSYFPRPGGQSGAGASKDGFDFQAFGFPSAGTETDATDAGFETARETGRDSTTEAFETSYSRPGSDDDDDSELTETEGGGLGRSGTVREATASPVFMTKAAKRRSLQSTASTSASEGEDGEEGMLRTPVQAQHPKYKLRLNRGGRRSGRVSDIREASPGMLPSPNSSASGTPQAIGGQSLGDELDAMDDGSSLGGTPSRMSEDLAAVSPETERQASLEPSTPSKDVDGVEGEREPEISSPTLSPSHAKPEGEQAQTAYQANVAMLAHEILAKKAVMVDAGVMTEAWEPETRVVYKEALAAVGEKVEGEKDVEGKDEEHKPTIRERAGEMVGGALGGALAGFGLGRVGRSKEATHAEVPSPEAADNEALHDRAPYDEAALDEPVATGAPNEERNVQGGEKRLRPAASSSDLPMALTGMVTKDDRAPQPVVDEDTSTLFAKEPKSLAGAVTEPLSAAKEHRVAPEIAPIVALQHSAIISQETEPILAPHTPVSEGIAELAAKPEVPLAAAAPLAVQAEAKRNFNFSGIDAQEFEPVALPDAPPSVSGGGAARRQRDFDFSDIYAQDAQPTPLVPKRSSRRIDMLYDSDGAEPASDVQDFGDEIPGTEAARAGAGFFASMASPPLTRKRSRSVPVGRTLSQEDEMLIEPKVFGGMREGSNGIPTLVFGSDDESGPETHGRLSAVPAADRKLSTESMIPVTKPLQIKKSMVDEGAQTVVSGGEIDDMLRNKSRTSSMVNSVVDASLVSSATGSPSQRRSIDGMAGVDPLGRGPRRPASAGSMRSKTSVRNPPPLPEDYTQKIAAVGGKAPVTPGPAAAGTMGPPIMPASAYKQNRQGPKTPGERALHHERSMSRDGTTPRAVRQRDSRGLVQSSSGNSRRTSVSSFASELDERFNITRADIMYPGDVAPSTDPRMIQAITQTMIGEYLWKYTRKAGRSETSTTRHRRFFWIHPYTRTLYWSEQDPSTAGRNMLKAKSMAIQSVRVITDDNTYPPGLHRKSIVVVTPGRDVVFTAPTGQRHETWFNALSYLLLRTEQEKQEANDTFNEEDIEEFNPGFSLRRSISRMTGRDGAHSRTSLSSYNSRTTRTSSPQRREVGGGSGSLAQRQSQAAMRAKSSNINPAAAPPTLAPPPAADASRTSTMRSRTSMSGRFSSLTSRFRPASSSQRGNSVSTRGRSSMSMRSRTGDPSDIYDASVVGESAEDLRAVIERQERDADRLENVRACCDGKHDVGSISRHGKGRHSSLTSRFGGSHAHSHSHPRAEPIKESQRPRRGE